MRMVKREKLNTEVRQEQIIQAAMNLIASGGLKGLSMAALANRIGLVRQPYTAISRVRMMSWILFSILFRRGS